MKFLIMPFLISSAFACPSLEGSYPQCRSQNGTSANLKEVLITQTEADGVTTYTIDAIEDITNARSLRSIIANNIVDTKVDSDGVTETTLTYCDDIALVQEITFSREGLVLGTGKSTMTKLGTRVVTNVVANIAGTQMIDTVTCE